jgi:hypothetical protein
MSEREHTTVMIRKSTKPRFEEAKEAVAKEIGENPTNADVVQELAEAYLGGDSLGRWRDK